MIGAWFSRLVGTKFIDGDRPVKTALRHFIHYHSCCLQGRPCDGNRWCKEVRFGSRLCENAAVAAQWKVGRMYAIGDGVPQDDQRAFIYFSQIANTHPDEPPGTAQARLVANAFVALGHYYLTGIPNSAVVQDAARAR